MVQPDLHDGVQEGPDPLSILAEAAEAMHRERDRRRLLGWVADAACRLTSATAAGVWLGAAAEPDGVPSGDWVSSGQRACDPALLGDLHDVISFEPVFDGVVATVPDVVGAADARLRRLLAGTALVAVPLATDDGIVVGALVLAFSGTGVPDDRVLGLARTLAAHTGVALENLLALERLAELEASQRSVVRQLQEAVFPPAPNIPHAELGMHYVPSEESAPTGGDLHDWVLLPDGNLHLVVVDIMGKGVSATKDALAVTHALRLLVFDGCPLETLVERADALVSAQNPELVATVVIGRYDPETGRLLVVGGGHPPPLLVGKTGVRELDAMGIPIGWPGAGSFGVVEAMLDRSDTLLLYTDGLVETTKDIMKGIERLSKFALETSRYPAQNMARALVDRVLRGVLRHDDSLALVLRRRTPPDATGTRHLLHPFAHRFSPNNAGVSLARHLLGDWLVRLPLEGPEADDILLIASELSNNAVRHSSGAPASVVLRAWVDEQDLVIEVEDDGEGLAWPEALDEMPDTDAEQGRGLFLVNALADEVEGEAAAGRNLVRAVKRAIVGLAPPS